MQSKTEIDEANAARVTILHEIARQHDCVAFIDIINHTVEFRDPLYDGYRVSHKETECWDHLRELLR